MKIGIFTFHCAINYGAVLQAYALQEYLKSLGHNVFIIDYRPSYLTYPYRIFRWNEHPNRFIPFIKWFIRELLVVPIRWKRRNAFNKFIYQQLNMCKLDLNDTSNDFDAFVFGSDQIWNPNITRGIDPVFIGNFPAAESKKLYSYAGSIGAIENLTDEQLCSLNQGLDSFVKVGVREKHIMDLLHNKQKAHYTIDPILLAGDNIFKNKLNRINFSTPYILLFTLGREEYVAERAQYMSKYTGMRVVEVVSSRESILNMTILQTITPLDLVTYIANSSYVVTSSYHGLLLSLIFKKEFNYVYHNHSTASRSLDILSELGVSDHAISYLELNKSDIKEVDYTEVMGTIKRLREDATQWLNLNI